MFVYNCYCNNKAPQVHNSGHWSPAIFLLQLRPGKRTLQSFFSPIRNGELMTFRPADQKKMRGGVASINCFWKLATWPRGESVTLNNNFALSLHLPPISRPLNGRFLVGILFSTWQNRHYAAWSKQKKISVSFLCVALNTSTSMGYFIRNAFFYQGQFK